MGFISGTSTVSVQARLTDAGKRKLYESIESQTGSFITQFGLGDSDANYVAIDEGSGSLEAGHVPEAGDFLSKPRSFAIYQGIYRPGVPVILKNGDPIPELDETIDISGNDSNVVRVALKTEWPKGQLFNENYWVELNNPTSISNDRFNEIFSWSMIDAPGGVDQNGNSMTIKVLEVRFNGGLSLSEIVQLAGNGDGETDFYINITGQQSRRFTRINFRVVSSK